MVPGTIDDAWGPEVSGLRASVTLDRRVYQTGEEIRFRYKVRNDSAKPVTVWNAGFWPNHRIDLKRVDGAVVPRTEAGEQALAAHSSGERRKNAPHTLVPGAEVTESHELTSLFRIDKPGEYNLQVTYADNGIELPSNVAVFVLR